MDGDLQDDTREDIQYLRVKLAYQAGREKNNGPLKALQKRLDTEIQKINTKTEWEKFAKLMETIVAYHKFYGGKD
ncbi:CRISPR-associated protein Csm2 [Candidatus Termititenax persephonae]|uniref:CRISPR system Cms protein Csm2 n=1 Tax=Candidatus Termititenax persephonae TaxID=2218525 RepID=A0A388TFS5_9BACT|nr:CRISPR-associated protein Csm2 [Candidatus Termititenax persephonae]